jgi:hypothetical protein
MSFSCCDGLLGAARLLMVPIDPEGVNGAILTLAAAFKILLYAGTYSSNKVLPSAISTRLPTHVGGKIFGRLVTSTIQSAGNRKGSSETIRKKTYAENGKKKLHRQRKHNFASLIPTTN